MPVCAEHLGVRAALLPPYSSKMRAGLGQKVTHFVDQRPNGVDLISHQGSAIQIAAP